MAEILAFIENDMYVRNFLSSGVFDELMTQRQLKISASELVSHRSLRPWEAVRAAGYERHPRNRRVVFGFNKLAIRRYRQLSSTFAIKARTGIPFGTYDLRERIKSHPWVYDHYVAPRLLSRISANESLEAVIAKERPKLVIFPITGVESTGYELIRLSRRYDFRTFFLVNGWDNLSSKTVFGELPDYMGLWGRQSMDDACSIHGLPADRGFLLGCARYEPYFSGRDFNTSPFSFPYAVFAGATTPYDELTPLRMFDQELSRLGAGEFKIVYRPHPWRDKRNCDDLFKAEEFRHTVLDPQVEEAYYDNKRTGQESVSAKSMPSLDYYPALLNNASFVISPISSMSLEAALFNVPAIVLANDDGIHELSAHLLAQFKHFEGGRQVKGWQFVDQLSDLSQTLEQVYGATREDSPSSRSFAPLLARSMAPFLHMDQRSYGRRLLDAVDVILDREGFGSAPRTLRADALDSNLAQV